MPCKVLNFNRILDQLIQVRVKSVTDSLFKYGSIVLVITLIAAIFKVDSWVVVVFFVVAIILFMVALIIYVYFAFKAPDYLRSESYQLRKQSLELLGDNDRATNPNIRNVPSITNPYNKEVIDSEENPMLKQ